MFYLAFELISYIINTFNYFSRKLVNCVFIAYSKSKNDNKEKDVSLTGKN